MGTNLRMLCLPREFPLLEVTTHRIEDEDEGGGTLDKSKANETSQTLFLQFLPRGILVFHWNANETKTKKRIQMAMVNSQLAVHSTNILRKQTTNSVSKMVPFLCDRQYARFIR